VQRILVTGATGSLGSNVIAEAVQRGLEVRALVRDPARVHDADGVELVQGDALDSEALTRALEGREALFHIVNVALGGDWVDTTARLLDSALIACRTTGARLVFPGNVWIYGRGSPGDKIPESRAPTPCSKLGRARLAKEERLRASGARFVVVRLPEFYGPHVQTLTGPPLKRIVAGRTSYWFGPPDIEVSSCSCSTPRACCWTCAWPRTSTGKHSTCRAPLPPRRGPSFPRLSAWRALAPSLRSQAGLCA
jgi:nucleoside-diphosphate-sugar epimerase